MSYSMMSMMSILDEDDISSVEITLKGQTASSEGCRSVDPHRSRAVDLISRCTQGKRAASYPPPPLLILQYAVLRSYLSRFGGYNRQGRSDNPLP